MHDGGYIGLFHPKSSIRVEGSAVGDRTELTIISKLVDVGYNVLKPVNSALRYDLVIEDADGKFWRVQCKTGRYKNGVVEFNSTGFYSTSAHRSYVGDVDYFAVYCDALKKTYLVPVSHVPVGHGKLRVDAVKYMPSNRKNHWAQDYEL